MRIAALLLVVTLSVRCHAAAEVLPDLRSASQEMATAAQNFWNALTPDQQKKAYYEITDAERKNWHFIPKSRNGLPLKEMTPAQRHLAYAFLASSLGQRGYMNAVSIMSLEQVLHDIENKAPHRDAEMYFFTLFGKPDAEKNEKAWAWRLEGHHLAINFTVVPGVFASAAPAFYGTNPAEIREGPRKGQRILAQEEDLGRALVTSLSDEQRKTAIFSEECPKDIITMASKQAKGLEPKGIAAAQLNEGQKTALANLIKAYLARSRPEAAKATWERIEKAGFDTVHFGWAGSTEVGKAHYYRVQNAVFVIEYDNIQNNANHVHSVLRDLENDFGDDVLRKHYEESHK